MTELIPKNVTLTGKKVVLRSYCEEDANGIYHAVMESVVALSQWMPWCHMDYSIADHKKWSKTRQLQWDEGIEYDFVIFKPDSSLPLGICGINGLDRQNHRANLGYWIRSSQTGYGYATAAARLLAGFGFDTLHLNRIEILIAADNAPSHRVAEKLGVIREGILRQRLVVGGKIHDAVLYAWIKRHY